MTKFEVGDEVVRVNYEWGGMRTGDTSVVTHALSSGSVILRDYAGQHSPRSLVLVHTAEDELPPAPNSVMYFNSKSTEGNDQRLIVDMSFPGEVVVNVVRRGCKYNNDPADVLSIGLEPDDAIQLAHDIYRMARAAKKAQAK